VLAGKSRIVFLLNAAHLGGIGGQQAKLGPVCDDDIDGGMATMGSTVYLPCLSGIVAVSAAGPAPGLRVLWTSRIGGGPPIVAGGLVWSISGDGTLSGIDPATGKLRQRAYIGVPANHFPTPGVGDGLLLAPSADRVVAFRAGTGRAAASPSSSATASPASQPTAGRAGAPGGSGGTGGGIPPAAIGGIAAGVLILAGGAGWLVYRRRRPGSSEPPA
jgi:outer membrane protein assembly factor BamB